MASRVIIKDFDPEGPFAGMFLPPRFRKRQSETRFKQEWKLTPIQYLALMGEFKGPKHQRGIIQMGTAGVIAASEGSGVTGSVVLTNKSVTDNLLGGPNTAGIRFDSDGGLTGTRSNSADSQYTGQWWDEEPDVGIGSSYEVRGLTPSSGGWTTPAAASNVWITIGSSRAWTKFSFSGYLSVTAVFEVGLDGVESALDSGTITCTADGL